MTSHIPVYSPALDTLFSTGGLREPRSDKVEAVEVQSTATSERMQNVRSEKLRSLNEDRVREREPESLHNDHSEAGESRRQEALTHSGSLAQFVQGQATSLDAPRPLIKTAPPNSPQTGGLEEVSQKQQERGGGGQGGQGQGRGQGGGERFAGQAQSTPGQTGPQLNTGSATHELNRVEIYRQAKSEEALKIGLRQATQLEGGKLTDFAVRHGGHSIQSLLKKAYRLEEIDDLHEDDAVNCLGLVLKLGGEFTYAHSARVLELAMDLADEVGIDDPKTRKTIKQGCLLKDLGEGQVMLDQGPPGKMEKVADWLSSDDMRKAGLLHDIGKIRVPPEILYKPGKLTEEEYNLMKMHPVIGEEIVYPIKSLRHLCPTIRGHHERWDGKGYPDGLAGENIPLPARVIAVADVFDALAAERPYKAAMPVEKVKAILKEGRGTHFDPDLVDAFERVLQRRYPEMSNPFA